VPRKVTSENSDKTRSVRRATSPEARENQMIALATSLAEKQLLDGTAKSQVIVHYLKLGSTKERIEKEILEKQKELITAKTEALQSERRVEELYANALKAMRTYRGEDTEEDENTDIHGAN